MDEYEQQEPFSDVLDQLFGDEAVSIPLLFRLSDPLPEDLLLFRQRWAAIADERRRIVARHIADLTETNFEVNFAPTLAVLLQDENPAVRLAALDGLWDTDDLALVSPIIDLVENDPEENVRALAAATLGHYVLMGEWGQIPRTTADRIVEFLLGILEDPDTAVAVQRTALESIGPSHNPRVAELIEEFYFGDDERQQLSAVFAMGGSADERWLPYLLDEMTNPWPEMRQEAALAAGKIGDVEAIPALAELTADEEREVRLQAVQALGEIGSEAARHVLVSLLEDEDAEDLHEAVTEALEEMDWLGGEIDLSIFELDKGDGDEPWGWEPNGDVEA